jgi:hypothetical protein
MVGLENHYLNAPGLPPVLVERRTIVSIWPRALMRRDMPFFKLVGETAGRGISNYVIPAAPRGFYTAVEIFTSGQWVKSYDSDLQPEGREARFVPVQNLAAEIVNSFVQTLRVDATGLEQEVGHIGLGILPQGLVIPEDSEENSPALDRWLDELLHKQEVLMNHWVERAHGVEKRKDIHSLSFIGAEWLYGSDGAKQFEWFSKPDFKQTKLCPVCGLAIPANSLKHGHPCDTFFPEFYSSTRYTQTEVQRDDPHVAQWMRNRGLFSLLPTDKGDKVEESVIAALAAVEGVVEDPKLPKYIRDQIVAFRVHREQELAGLKAKLGQAQDEMLAARQAADALSATASLEQSAKLASPAHPGTPAPLKPPVQGGGSGSGGGGGKFVRNDRDSKD